jgi:hypothetical protein
MCVFPNARQCSARSKRSGQRCRGPAVIGWSVCRFHGAKGGAPKGPANGRYRDGRHTNDAKASRAYVAALIREARDTVRSA